MATKPVQEKAVIVGAGLMGTGIAHAFATSGYQVVLIDVNVEALTKAKANIAKIVEDGVRLASGKRRVVRHSTDCHLARRRGRCCGRCHSC
jgi:3-hydroxybutyryl-CoA dehydrogenase